MVEAQARQHAAFLREAWLGNTLLITADRWLEPSLEGPLLLHL